MGVRNEAALRPGVGGQDTGPEGSTDNSGPKSGTEEKSKTEGEEKEPRTVGVSHQSLKDIADKIGLDQPETGDVLSPKEYSDRGQALLKAGADPDQLEADFKKDGLVNADRVSVARAQYNKLVKDASDAYDTKGKNSLEYKQAKAKADQWQKEVLKPMITKGFAEVGRASQGETDIDTGSFISMSRAFEDQYGKAPNEEQEAAIKEVSDKVKDLTQKVSDLEQKLTEAIDKNAGEGKTKATYKEKAQAVADAFRKLKTKPFTFKDENGNDIEVTKMGTSWNDAVELGAKIIEKTGEIADGVSEVLKNIKDADWYKNLSASDKDKFAVQVQQHYEENAPEIAVKSSDPEKLATRLVDKKTFDPKDAKDIWEYAKSEYLRKGSTFDNMITGVATDLGLSADQVRKAITSPKGAKVISDEMYAQQYKQQQAIRDATTLLNTANESRFERNKVVKFVKSLPSYFFAAKTFGHGTVGFVTHSGMNIATPSAWKTFWPNFVKQFKFAFGGTTKSGLADYQQAMTDLVHRPKFAFWKRNGLAVDPVKSYDDYQQFNKGLRKITDLGDRGFNALKLQRYDLAEHYYNKLSNIEKADPGTAKKIASIVNHSTGTADIPVPKAIGVAVFAPRLEAARWNKLFIEPAQAVKTLYNWKEATPGEKAASKIVIKRAAEMAGVYLSGLAANSAALSIAGSKQSINYADPTKYDFLKFKAGDKTFDMTGGMLSLMHLLGSLVKEGVGNKKMVRGVPEDKSKTMGETIMNYGRGKLSPIASTVTDIATQADYGGRPLPFSSDKGTKLKPQYTWTEYIEDQQLPIPVSEAFKVTHDQMRDAGVPEATANQVITGIISGVISGGSGARVGVDYSADKKEGSQLKRSAKSKAVE